MANAFDTETDAGGGAPPPAGPGGAPGGGGPGSPPQGGGPILAALARNQQGPQTSQPGAGNMAGAMNDLNTAIQLMQKAQINLPAGSPLHKDVNSAIGRLSRHLPQGAPTEGVQLTGLRDLIRNVMQSGFLGKIMQQMQGGQQGGQPGGGPDQSAGPSPNLAMQGTPSTPLPGA